MKIIPALLLASAMISSAWATPSITSVGNAASYDTEVAQGSMVVVIGTELGPDPIVVATTFPLLTSFAGTSAQITVNGVTTDGILYYTSRGQIAFVLPSETPAGTGAITVAYNGETSAPFPITVVNSQLGFYTQNSSGSGPGVATFHSSVDVPSLYPSNTNAINPGDLVILWANGLGPVPFEETIGAEFLDMTEVPLELFVNGQTVDIFYQGRSPGCCTSVDNIFFYWPDAAPASSDLGSAPRRAANSCNSTISAQIGGKVSNMITVPSADAGRICSNLPDNGGGGGGTGGFSSAVTQADIDQLLTQSQIEIGFVSLENDTEVSNGELESEEDASAGFMRIDTDVQGGVAALQNFFAGMAVGVCTTEMYQTGQFTIPTPIPGLTATTMPAGNITVATGRGTRTLDQRVVGDFTIYFDDLPTGFLGGSTTINGTGSADVNPFNITLDTQQPLVVTNRAQLLQPLTRANGIQVNWTGGHGIVKITGTTRRQEGFTTFIKTFSCNQNADAGEFFVPGNIASFVEPTGITTFGDLDVESFSITKVPGTNLDLLLISDSGGDQFRADYK